MSQTVRLSNPDRDLRSEKLRAAGDDEGLWAGSSAAGVRQRQTNRQPARRAARLWWRCELGLEPAINRLDRFRLPNLDDLDYVRKDHCSFALDPGGQRSDFSHFCPAALVLALLPSGSRSGRQNIRQIAIVTLSAATNHPIRTWNFDIL
jgi:hypothetical protein